MIFWIYLACTETKTTDTSTSTIPNESCLTDMSPLESFELFEGQPTTQIHADIAFDGQWIWTVFNLPNEQAKFDVYLAALDCEGNTVVPPSQVLDITDLNQTTPRIAISGDHVLVASQGDNGSSSNNLSIHLHVQDTSGNLVTQQEWIPTIDGEATGNRWLPSVVGTENGFWLTGAVANTQHFRTAVQKLTYDGEPQSEPFWVGPDAYAVFPNIDGTNEEFVVGWETGDDSVMWTTGNLDGPTADVIEQENAAYVKVLWNNGTPHIFANKRTPLTVQWNDAAISQWGNTHYPNAAQGVSTTLLSHFRIQSGYSNDVYMAALDDTGILFQDSLIQETPAAAPYRPAITSLGGNSYMIAWSAGNNPDFTLRGMFIDLTSDE